MDSDDQGATPSETQKAKSPRQKTAKGNTNFVSGFLNNF